MPNLTERTKEFLHREGLTISEFFATLGEENSTLLNFSKEQQEEYDQLYDQLVNQNYTVHTKGALLETLSQILFDNSLFEVRGNCKTCTNEIDILITWSERARVATLNQSYPCFGDHFLCECKNYKSKVDVTYIGKFASLLESSSSLLGIMISWEGITGSKWDFGVGLVKKLALSNRCKIIVIDKEDLGRIRRKEVNIFKLIQDKVQALQTDIDFSKYIIPHEAEGKLRPD